jgi:O-antigen ligase
MAGVAAAPLVASFRFLAARPATLAALTVALVCVPTGERYLTSGANVTAADLGSFCLVAVAGLRVLAGDRLPRSRLWLAVAAAAVGFGVAAVASPDPVTSATGFVRYLQVFVLVPLAVVLVVRDRRDIWLVCGAVLATATVQGTVGVWQYLTGTGASYGTRDIRAVGTFGALEVMGMATVVGYGVVFAVGLAAVQRTRARVLLLALAILLVVPLLWSLSRGAAIATGCATAAMLIAASPRLAARTAVFAAAATVVVASLVPGTGGAGARLATVGTLSSTPDRSVADRYDLWRTATRMWQDHPVTGVGPKQFPAYRDSYAPLSLSSGSDVADPTIGFLREPLLSPHNMYLLVLSEQGLVGAVALCGLLLGLAVLTFRRTVAARDGAGPPDGSLPDGRLVSVVAVGVVTWTLVSFAYGDIGGSPTVLTSVVLGLALWWAVQPLAVAPGGTR